MEEWLTEGVDTFMVATIAKPFSKVSSEYFKRQSNKEGW